MVHQIRLQIFAGF